MIRLNKTTYGAVPFLLNYVASFVTWYRMEKKKVWTFVLPLLNVYPIFGNTIFMFSHIFNICLLFRSGQIDP